MTHSQLPHGIYDALLDKSLRDILGRAPELRTVLGKLDPEEEPAHYAAFPARVSVPCPGYSAGREICQG